MRLRWCILPMGLGLIGLLVAWGTGAFAGKPILPLSNRDGTERVFPVSRDKAIAAITNAFAHFRYRQMMLTEAVGSDYLAAGWHPTDGFLLCPGSAPIATVRTKGVMGKRLLPYEAYFHITLTSVETNQTKISARTVLARVFDGITLTRSGTGPRPVGVPPIRSEEENVLGAIAAEFDLSKDRVIQGPQSESTSRSSSQP